jgi:hypothetical protein
MGYNRKESLLRKDVQDDLLKNELAYANIEYKLAITNHIVFSVSENIVMERRSKTGCRRRPC